MLIRMVFRKPSEMMMTTAKFAQGVVEFLEARPSRMDLDKLLYEV